MYHIYSSSTSLTHCAHLQQKIVVPPFACVLSWTEGPFTLITATITNTLVHFDVVVRVGLAGYELDCDRHVLLSVLHVCSCQNMMMTRNYSFIFIII